MCGSIVTQYSPRSVSNSCTFAGSVVLRNSAMNALIVASCAAGISRLADGLTTTIARHKEATYLYREKCYERGVIIVIDMYIIYIAI